MRRVVILAHRGYSGRYPENTALAFTQALESGADGVECDVQKSRDGRYVVIHDDTVDRTSDGQGRVAELDLAELKALDFGRGERILELQELLALLPFEVWLNVELKEETLTLEDAARIAELLSAQGRGRRSRFLVSSFEHRLLAPFRRSGIPTGALIGEKHAAGGVRALLGILLRLRPDCLNLPIQAFERAPAWQVRLLARFAQLLGGKVVFWTINRRDQFEKVRDLCDVIITDEVAYARQWLGRGRLREDEELEDEAEA